MKMKNLIAPVLLSVMMGGCQMKSNFSNENEEMTAKYFDVVKSEKDNAQLTLFFSQMPKGGDIHHHYSGALYAETYLDWAATKNWTIDSQLFGLDTMGSLKKPFITIDSLKNNTQLYRAVLEKWSDLNFSDYCHLEDQPDQHFFSTFNYFGTISSAYYRMGLQDLKNRAKKENVQYIETMLNCPPISLYCPKVLTDSLLFCQRTKDVTKLTNLFDLLSRMITSAPDYNARINAYRDSLMSYHAGIDDPDFSMRFQTYATRNTKPDDVFTKLYSSFDAVTRDKSSLIVGVNIVGPENRVVAMRDYWLHMQMFSYLKKKFPNVRTAMHAGELTLGMVKPEDLTYHINNAVSVAKANRIGHGVDIPYETGSVELLKKMKDSGIAVEINLSSNEFILGVKNENHPINIYVKAGVPLVIATDDAGVSRNNLTIEYVKLASRYGFSYKEFKQFVYNSIQYSFIDTAGKKKLFENLDKKFITFESKMASLYSDVKSRKSLLSNEK